jgi:hypothetical protein
MNMALTDIKIKSAAAKDKSYRLFDQPRKVWKK